MSNTWRVELNQKKMRDEVKKISRLISDGLENPKAQSAAFLHKNFSVVASTLQTQLVLSSSSIKISVRCGS